MESNGYRDARECWPLVFRAVQLLAGHFDGARARDFEGFNKKDTRVRRRLANCPWWTLNLALDAHQRLRKYRKQLAGEGIEYDSIPTPYLAERSEALLLVNNRITGDE